MKEFVAVFRNVRGLLSDPLHWTKHALARVSRYFPVAVDHKDANCFCMIGAFHRVCGDNILRGRALSMVRDEINNGVRGTELAISDWNDSPNRTHADVLQLLDKLIAKCENADV